MLTAEQNVRNYLKSFTVEDIANSVYLFGMDFDTVPIELIMESLGTLYEEVKTLKGMIDRDFNPVNGEILPKDPVIQSNIIQDCFKKESALLKALSNKDVYEMFINYKKAEKKVTASPTK